MIERSLYDQVVAENLRLRKEANGYIYYMNKSLLLFTKLDPPISFSKLFPSCLLVWDCLLGSSKLEESNPKTAKDSISFGKNSKICSGKALDQSG